ncbi:MAG: ATP synthase F1 subunit delta [Gammaproteobacteria bacterium]|nr:MAG: ATP synthase F1 subunit delta [Gammaproteobacteria bacterium]
MARNAKHIVHEIYSDVMFELAQEAGLIDQVTDDLEAISGVLADEPEFLSLLTLSEIKPDEKAQIVRRVFKDRINGLTLDFLCVLAKRNRMSFLHGIGQRYQVLSDEHKHLYRIEVTLAKQPTDAELEKLKVDIRDAMNAEIKLSVTVDSEIIGGIVIRKGDLMIDNSVRTILDRTVNAVVDRSKHKSINQEEKSA